MLKRKPGTVTDLLVLLVCCVVLGTLAIASSHRLAANDARNKCAANLRMIGQAMFLYANDNHQTYPRGIWDPKAPVDCTSAGGPGKENVDTDPFDNVNVKMVNNVPCAIFWMLRNEDLTSDVFVCPAGSASADSFGSTKDTAYSASNRCNFQAIPDNLGYSMANPYPNANVQFKWNASLPATFALFADINPGYDAKAKFCANAPKNPDDKDNLKTGNSPNHGGEGENVLFADGHVEWSTTPFCGDNHDNIYTVSDGKDGPNYTNPTANAASPAHPLDSVLLPCASITPPAGK